MAIQNRKGSSLDWREQDAQPFWMLNKQAAKDNKWLEAGVYSFICEHCKERNEQTLKAVKVARTHFDCFACGKRNSA